MDFDMVAAALRQDAADVATYARVLTVTLADVLPPGSVEVEYERSLSDRLKGREGHPSRIVVRLGERTLCGSRPWPGNSSPRPTPAPVPPRPCAAWSPAPDLTGPLVANAADLRIHARAGEARGLTTGGHPFVGNLPITRRFP
jgi:hypothetical protein